MSAMVTAWTAEKEAWEEEAWEQLAREEVVWAVGSTRRATVRMGPATMRALLLMLSLSRWRPRRPEAEPLRATETEPTAR